MSVKTYVIGIPVAFGVLSASAFAQGSPATVSSPRLEGQVMRKVVAVAAFAFFRAPFRAPR